jgi:hypothetical protein
VPLFIAGAAIRSVLPVGQVVEGGGLSIMITSYCSEVSFGFTTCPAVVDAPWDLADGVQEELRDLVTAAGPVDVASG